MSDETHLPQFDKAVKIVQELPKKGLVQPSQDDQLYFYSYFKQAKFGDVDTPSPTGMFDFAAKAKWNAWNKVKGTSKEDARQAYVERLIELLEKAGDASSLQHIKDIKDAAEHSEETAEHSEETAEHSEPAT